MSDSKHITTGTVAFSNMVERDTYKGKPTKFGLTLTFSNEEAAKLEALGVKLKDYEGVAQRAFKTDFIKGPTDVDGLPLWENEKFELPRGTVVKIWFTLIHNDEHGMIPYLGGTKVLEMGEGNDAPEEF